MKKTMLCVSLLCLSAGACYAMKDDSIELENPGLDPKDNVFVLVEAMSDEIGGTQKVMSVDQFIKNFNFGQCKVDGEELFDSNQLIDMMKNGLERMEPSVYNELVSSMVTRKGHKKGKKNRSTELAYVMRDINYTLQMINGQLARDVEKERDSYEKEKVLKIWAYRIAGSGLCFALLEFIVGGGWLTFFCGEGT